MKTAHELIESMKDVPGGVNSGLFEEARRLAAQEKKDTAMKTEEVRTDAARLRELAELEERIRTLASLVRKMRLAQAAWMCREGDYDAYREADNRLDEAVRQVLEVPSPALPCSEEGAS